MAAMVFKITFAYIFASNNYKTWKNTYINQQSVELITLFLVVLVYALKYSQNIYSINYIFFK